MRVDEWLRNAEVALRGLVDSPRLEAQVLAAHALGCERAALLAHPEWVVPEEAGVLLERRIKGEPLAYILGWREFYGRRFEVSPAVLIPRQETELLVDVALTTTATEVLDIGTGSGILAVTMKLERPGWRVTGCDISTEALDVARTNAKTLAAEVDFVESDLLSAFGDKQFDVIVSNPPYIGAEESIPAEVRNHEPHAALFAGEKGLAIFRRLSKEAPAHLSSNGKVLLEVGHEQAEIVVQLFEEEGWEHLQTVQDLAGIPRVVAFMRP